MIDVVRMSQNSTCDSNTGRIILNKSIPPLSRCGVRRIGFSRLNSWPLSKNSIIFEPGTALVTIISVFGLKGHGNDFETIYPSVRVQRFPAKISATRIPVERNCVRTARDSVAVSLRAGNRIREVIPCTDGLPVGVLFFNFSLLKVGIKYEPFSNTKCIKNI